MLKKLAPIFIINVIIVLVFLYTNFAIANIFNSNPNILFSVHWTFGAIDITQAGTVVEGKYYGIGGTQGWPDYALWLFFVSTAINIVYIVKLLREQETKLKK